MSSGPQQHGPRNPNIWGHQPSTKKECETKKSNVLFSDSQTSKTNTLNKTAKKKKVNKTVEAQLHNTCEHLVQLEACFLFSFLFGGKENFFFSSSAPIPLPQLELEERLACPTIFLAQPLRMHTNHKTATAALGESLPSRSMAHSPVLRMFRVVDTFTWNFQGDVSIVRNRKIFQNTQVWYNPARLQQEVDSQPTLMRVYAKLNAPICQYAPICLLHAS